MARPSKPVAVMVKNLTKEEIEARQETEKNLRGQADKIVPPRGMLNNNQKKIFNYIVGELKASEVLGNLDVYVLAKCSVSIDRMLDIERQINERPNLMKDKDLRLANDYYTKTFFRTCNELGLSPQSRAKLGNINLQAKQEQEDPLLEVLRK
ncbi:phage terminase, small subunit [Andreesenia angusta]|uniref:Phage terminase, small subunit n=1 Tax=Andreesenia angusta TaxID=39480 RepID=A0A1S1V8J6_9FIRM|nr:P27 family phage terminase small subunit [Andreesenia angusta]OHW62918.1 phage terminase, small subunit [Andreesenia angusta]